MNLVVQFLKNRIIVESYKFTIYNVESVNRQVDKFSEIFEFIDQFILKSVTIDVADFFMFCCPVCIFAL